MMETFYSSFDVARKFISRNEVIHQFHVYRLDFSFKQ
jgi:hypothetical protein